MPFSTGQELNNRYRIVKKLAEGGFGAVYHAWDKVMETPCALKESFDVSLTAEQQFRREAQFLFKLQHRNLPKVYDYFLEMGIIPCLVMNYVEGETLAEKLQVQGRSLPEKDVLSWADQICAALTYLHGLSPPVIHRDIKPENIKIQPDGRAILLDFGLAKTYILGVSTTIGARGVTPGYSPHEQYGQSGTNARSDIYALGATLYELVTCVTPPESINRVFNDPLKLPRQLNPALSARTEQALLKALAVQPKNRYQSVRDFQTALFVSPAPPPLRVWITGGCGLLAVGAIIIGAIIAAGTERVGQTAIAIGSKPSGTASLTPTASETPIPIPSATLTASKTLMPTATYTPTVTPTNTNTSAPAPEPGATRVSEKDGMVMAYVPAGEFEMGLSDEQIEKLMTGLSNWRRSRYDRDQPQHPVYLDAYWIDRTEVTTAMYKKCVESETCSKPSETYYYEQPKYQYHPIMYVDWYQANAYCEWAGRRLPTEAEWEKAARGTDGRPYPWGEKHISCDLANYFHCVGITSPVGSYPDGASPYGALDMAGNVDEWTNDWYNEDYYASSTLENPNGPDTGQYRVVRGGSANYAGEWARSTHRGGASPDYSRFGFIGFRCATSE